MINGDSERLDEIEKSYKQFISSQNPDTEIAWLISSLRLAWAQNEVMKECLIDIADCDFNAGEETYQAREALKRCEEFEGGK